MSANDPAKIRICFVCLGNICRSPTAEGVMLQLVREAGLSSRIEIDSAGTGAWHGGERADPRSRAEAKSRGVDLPSIARQFTAGDFDAFDYVIAMDRKNRVDLTRLAAGAAHERKVRLLRSFDAGADGPDVPDPYYGGDNGFARVFDICMAGCRGLLAHLRKEHGL
jgi:protein-tyrosine phosphatase